MTPQERTIIAESADYSHRYAYHVLGKRILEAEPLMAQDPVIWTFYLRDTFPKGV